MRAKLLSMLLLAGLPPFALAMARSFCYGTKWGKGGEHLAGAIGVVFAVVVWVVGGICGAV